MAEDNVFNTMAPAISPQDVDDVERAIGAALPDAFKQHYLRYNGGTPSNTQVPGDAKWEPTEVAMFYSIKYPLPGQDPGSEMLFHYRTMRAQKVIPDHFLPFAWDPGGNLFGLDLHDRTVSYYPTDMADPALSDVENYEKAARVVADSFEDFLKNLLPNPDPDW